MSVNNKIATREPMRDKAIEYMAGEDMRKIADIQIQKLVDRMETKGIHLDVSESARELLTENGYDPSYGARPLKRAIQFLLQNAVADALLEKQPSKGERLLADARNGRVKITREEKEYAR